MEKYCPKCHKVYEDLKANFCTICATKLITREKRKPIPPELRHQIFVRDGYRCRECGKSKDETSLEIDHIYPLSKGGTTTEDNLWTLCRDCNQAKRDDIWNDNDILTTRNELANLENQLHEAEEGLRIATDEDEIRDYKFKIKKFKTEYIPQVTNKLNNLIRKEKVIDSKRKKQKEENKRRERLFKDLYIELDGELLSKVCNRFSLTESSQEDNIRLLVDKYPEQEIITAISSIKKELKEKAIRKELQDRLYDDLTDEEIKLFNTDFSLRGSKQDTINYLIDNFTKNEIQAKIVEYKRKNDLINKLINECGNKELPNLFEYFSLNAETKEENLRLMNIKISEKEINNQIVEYKRKNEEYKRKNDLINKLITEYDDKELFRLFEDLSLDADTKEENLSLLVDKFSEKEINDKLINIRNKLKVEEEKKRRNERFYKSDSAESHYSLDDYRILL